MDLREAIYQRRAVRDYRGASVPKEMIEAVIRAAVQAPSAMNQQPWAFAVFQGRERLAGWSARAKQHFPAPASSPSTNDELHGLQQMLSDPAFNIFYNAHILVVICARADSMNGAEDCCLAAQNLMLRAYEMGLGTCPIGLARPWLNQSEVKSEIGIPADLDVVFPVIIGWTTVMPPPVPRREAEIVVWN